MTTFHDSSQVGDAGKICSDGIASNAVTRFAGLTEGQEAFAQAYARLGNGAEAYSLAFRADMRRKHLGECGRRLRKLPKVAARIAQLRGDEHPGTVAETVTADGSLLPRKGANVGQGGAGGRLSPEACHGAGEASLVRNGEPDAVSIGDLEAAAAIAFDAGESDLVRLIALRAVTACLGRLRRERGTVVVTVTFGESGRAPRSPGPS